VSKTSIPRTFQVWLLLSAGYAPYSIAFGISLLIGTAVIPGLLEEWILELADTVAIALALLLYWNLYKCLVFARDTKDPSVKRPLVWMILAFFPFINAYIVWVLLPRIVPNWLKKITGTTVTRGQVLVFFVMQVISGGIYRTALGDSLEPLALAAILDGFSLLGVAWVLRDVVMGRTTSAGSRA
jgi:hypothetical protein